MNYPESEGHVSKALNPGPTLRLPTLRPAQPGKDLKSTNEVAGYSGAAGTCVLRCQDRASLLPFWGKPHKGTEAETGRRHHLVCAAISGLWVRFCFLSTLGTLASQGLSISAQKMPSPASGYGSSLNSSRSCGQMYLRR